MAVETSSQGFTLLEVLVALTILALALGALIKTGSDHAALIGDLQIRTQGFMVAEQQLYRFQLERLWPEVGTRKQMIDQGGRRWYVLTTVENTLDADLRRITLEVKLQEDGPVQARLIGFLGRPR